jgi:hypothetical protein
MTAELESSRYDNLFDRHMAAEFLARNEALALLIEEATGAKDDTKLEIYQEVLSQLHADNPNGGRTHPLPESEATTADPIVAAMHPVFGFWDHVGLALGVRASVRKRDRQSRLKTRAIFEIVRQAESRSASVSQPSSE